MADMYDKNKSKEWSKRNLSAFEGLLNVNQFLPVTGDIQSGIMAANDVKQGNYGSAALNSLGLLPFIPALGGITLWHGSPHTFNKFDLSKSRTGHGAEAYSHGSYLSEGVDLAKGYQPRSDKLENSLSKLSEKAYNTNNYVAADIYDNFLLHKTPDEIASSINDMGYKGKDLLEANKALKQGTSLYQKQSSGGLYKVDLPDNYLPQILDWNKYLHEQPKPVYDALMKVDNTVSDNFTKQLLGSARGEDIYSALMNAHQLGKIPGEGTDLAASQRAASNFLNNIGIKGVKYYDTVSPGSGAGTYNYVVHDPNILKILERNGLLLP